MDGKETCHGKEKSWIRQRYRLHPRRRRQRRGAWQPLGLPVQDVAKRRRGLRAHLRRVRAAHRLRDDAQRDLSRPPRAGKPYDRLQDDSQEPRLVRARGDRDPRVHHLLLLRARRLDDEVRAQLLQRQRWHRRHVLRQHGRGHPLHRHLPRTEHGDHHGRRQGRHRESLQGAHAGAVSDPRRHRDLRPDARQRRERGPEVLPQARFLRHHVQVRARGHGPGVLLPVARHGHHDHLRFLHRQGSQPRALHCHDLRVRYARGAHRGPGHLPVRRAL